MACESRFHQTVQAQIEKVSEQHGHLPGVPR